MSVVIDSFCHLSLDFAVFKLKWALPMLGLFCVVFFGGVGLGFWGFLIAKLDYYLSFIWKRC